MPRRGAFGQAFREKLAESTRGRASRSRKKCDVNTIKSIADYLLDPSGATLSTTVPLIHAVRLSEVNALYVRTSGWSPLSPFGSSRQRRFAV